MDLYGKKTNLIIINIYERHKKIQLTLLHRFNQYFDKFNLMIKIIIPFKGISNIFFIKLKTYVKTYWQGSLTKQVNIIS